MFSLESAVGVVAYIMMV